MKIDIKTESEVTAVLKKLADAYADRNLNFPRTGVFFMASIFPNN